MPTNQKYLANFNGQLIYHVYNRTSNKEPLFKEDIDYIVFKNKIRTYLSDYLDIISFCLIENHFHLVVKLKSELEITNQLNLHWKQKKSALGKYQSYFLINNTEETFNAMIINQFRSLFISYVAFVNKKYNRNGSLFTPGFKRIEVGNETYLKQLISYVHWNPVKHLIEDKVELYEWSSFFEIANDDLMLTNKPLLFDQFGGMDHFLSHHRQETKYPLLGEMITEMP